MNRFDNNLFSEEVKKNKVTHLFVFKFWRDEGDQLHFVGFPLNSESHRFVQIAIGTEKLL